MELCAECGFHKLECFLIQLYVYPFHYTEKYSN